MQLSSFHIDLKFFERVSPHLRRRLRCLSWVSLMLLVFTGACGEREAPKGAQEAPEAAQKVLQRAKETPKTAQEAPEPKTELPAAVTAGDVLPALPIAAPRLFDGRSLSPSLPEISCVGMSPGRGWVLQRHLDVKRHPKKKGALGGTLELCHFSKVTQREDEELIMDSGRDHTFVAAFPGTTVASYTADHLKRKPTDARPEWALPRAAGWGALLPTGIPDSPALAVVSARFYDGPLGEQIHWKRRARLLVRDGEKWLWRPLLSRDFATLDSAHLLSACGRPEAENDQACLGSDEKVDAFKRAAGQRAEVRERRLTTRRGKRPKKRAKIASYPRDGDPQTAWLRDGRVALKYGRWRLAIAAALRIEVVCGEPIVEARALIQAALKKAGLSHERPSPPIKPVALCAPLSDKNVPKRPD